MFNIKYVLENKLAIVTGGSRGIGKALTIELIKNGANVLVIGSNKYRLTELKKSIFIKFNVKINTFVCDLENLELIDKISNVIKEHWKIIDIFIANAAILGPISPLKDINIQDFEKVLKINIISQWRLMSNIEPLLRKAEFGRVIFLSSSVAHKIKKFWGLYGSSKSMLESLAWYWCEELKHTNIKINCVNPGATRTDMRRQAMPYEDQNILNTPQEVAKKIIFLTFPSLKENGKIFDVKKNIFL